MDLLLARKAWEVVRKSEVCSRPYYVQFEITTHCNLACHMCVRNEAIKHPQHLAFDDFRKTIDQIHPPKLTPTGAGEPLLHPDLTRMLTYARDCGATVMISTNGTLLRREASAQGLIDSGLNVLKISIDAATAATYEAVRRQDCFDAIVEGIELLDRLKRVQNSRFPEMRFDIVILKENFHEIPDIIHLAARFNIRTVFFRALQAKGLGAELEETLGRDVDFDELYRSVRRGIEEATRLKVRTNLRDVARDFRIYKSIYVRHDATMAHHICLLPWLQCFISVKGELSPCCATYTNEGFSAGNVFADGFEAVWNGPKMKEIRRLFKARKNPFAVCRDCIPRSMPVLLRMSSMLPGFTYDD